MKKQSKKNVTESNKSIAEESIKSPNHALIDPMGSGVAPATTLSRQVLSEGYLRAVKFSHAMKNIPEARAALESVGYDERDQVKGWSLITMIGGTKAPTTPLPVTPSQTVVQKIEAWIGPNFRRAEAALDHYFPDQKAFVFEDLKVTRGALAVVSVATFLERLDQLESSPDRKATRKTDHAALAELAKRRITKEERTELAALCKSQQVLEPFAPAEAPTPSQKTEALIELHAWITDWSAMARTVITNRALLLRLGIGKRRSRSQSDAPPVTPAPPAVVPVLPATPVTPAPPQLPTGGSANTNTESAPPSKRTG